MTSNTQKNEEHILYRLIRVGKDEEIFTDEENDNIDYYLDLIKDNIAPSGTPRDIAKFIKKRDRYLKKLTLKYSENIVKRNLNEEKSLRPYGSAYRYDIDTNTVLKITIAEEIEFDALNEEVEEEMEEVGFLDAFENMLKTNEKETEEVEKRIREQSGKYYHLPSDDSENTEHRYREYIGKPIDFNFYQQCNHAAKYIIENLKLENPVIKMGCLVEDGTYIWGSETLNNAGDHYNHGNFASHFWVESGDYIYDINQENNTIFKVKRGFMKNETLWYKSAHEDVSKVLIDFYVSKL
jgi:hypothetical protein